MILINVCSFHQTQTTFFSTMFQNVYRLFIFAIIILSLNENDISKTVLIDEFNCKKIRSHSKNVKNDIFKSLRFLILNQAFMSFEIYVT